ncbi:MAG: molybdopterin-dependent oxidoreductase, partial [Myxococcales bacterium]|nr:molybdopterin-dependent oxidoreductase [Myxococcales bacterium]
DPYIAEDALSAIAVDYEELPPVLSAAEALDPATPPLYEGWPDNRQCVWDFTFGDVDGAFAEAHTVIRREIGAHSYSAVPLEMRALLADFDPRRRKLRVQISTQIPHQARTIFSWVFDLQETDVHVVAEDVGGGFGNKLQVDIELVPILMSVVTGRPVKWVERRSEWLATAPASRDFEHHIEGAFSADGKLLAVRDHLVGDLGCDGAVRAGGAGALLVGGTYVTGPYDVQRYQARVDGVVTNKAPYGAYRGYGKDIANLGMEALMDAAADALGIDPVAIRQQNLVDRYPYEIATGPIIESGSFGTCLTKVERAMALPALRARRDKGPQGPNYFGFALISVLEPSAGSIPMSLFNGYESATVRVDPSGNATVLTGMQHIGQGIETSATQVAADQLGVLPEHVRVICGDTDVVPYGLGSYSSRGATYGLSAIYEAARKVRDKMVRAAAVLLETDVESIELAHGWARVRESAAESGERRLSIADLAKAVYFFPGPYTVLPGEPEPTLEAHTVWTNPQVSWEPDAHGRVRIYPAHASGAQGATLTVDCETGVIDIEQLWIAHDSGKMVNPKIVEGQVIGGTIQGLGGVLYERLLYDERGALVTQSLADYQLPTMLSAPPVTVLHGEVPSPVTPLGTKGVGEAGAIGTPTVVMLALQNALAPLGVEVTHSPLTPENVLRMIDAAGGGA